MCSINNLHSCLNYFFTTMTLYYFVAMIIYLLFGEEKLDSFLNDITSSTDIIDVVEVDEMEWGDGMFEGVCGVADLP